MSQLGRLHDLLHRPTGVPAAGATVEVRRQGATVTSNQSGTAPFDLTVADNGAIVAGDTVAVGLGSTTYDVDSVSYSGGQTHIVLSGFAGTLALNVGDRLTPVNDLPDLKNDSQGINALPGGNPMQTDTNGEFSAWADISPYDLKVTGGGFTPRLFQDVWPAGVVIVRVNATPKTDGNGYVFDVKRLPSTGVIVSFQVDGVDKFHVNADGSISGSVAVSVPDPLTLVNGLTVGGLATFNAGAGVVGGLTVDNFTGTGTFTVAAGAIASAALADHAASAATAVVRGDAADTAASAVERVIPGCSTAFTPASTTSKVIITFSANYQINVSDTNCRHGIARLYIDGVLKFPFSFGPVSVSDTHIYIFPVTFTWIETGLSVAAHTIEVRDIIVQHAGTLGTVTYLGATVRAAMIIQELKK